MRLYIVRHGIAAPHGTPGFEENARPLTNEGVAEMKRIAAGLLRMGCVPDRILFSPLPRAEQTARIIEAAFGTTIPLNPVDALAPSGDRSEIYEELRKYPEFKSLMLVGHQPSLGEMAGAIAWGSPKHSIELKKGGACALQIETLKGTPKGKLLWLLTPKIMKLTIND
jgi:phosphohistidine phosphatase